MLYVLISLPLPLGWDLTRCVYSSLPLPLRWDLCRHHGRGVVEKGSIEIRDNFTVESDGYDFVLRGPSREWHLTADTTAQAAGWVAEVCRTLHRLILMRAAAEASSRPS